MQTVGEFDDDNAHVLCHRNENFTEIFRIFILFTVNRSTFVNKKSREQFQLSTYKRLIDIYSSTAKTVDALMRLELPSGVEVEIKVQ